MATRIPLPGLGSEGFQRGVEQGTSAFSNLLGQGIQRAQLHQQWQEHLRNAAIREQQEKRLMQEFEMAKQFHPYNLQKAQQEQSMAPLRFKELEAKIMAEQEKAKAYQKYGSQRPTAAVQEADILYDREDPRHALYILNKSKQYMPNEKEIAEEEKLKSSPEFVQIANHLQNAVPMNNLSPGTQNMYRKAMNEELVQIDKAKQVKHAIAQAREITKNNPNMYRKAINIIANPEATPGMIEKSLTTLLPEKDVEAFTSLAKLYADILTKQAQLNNMSRSVYSLKLQERAKPQVKNPDEVNEQIFKNIEHEIGPQITREKALLYAMKHNQYLPFTKTYSFEEIGEPNQIPSQVNGATQMGMMKGIINGQETDVDPEDKDDFIAAGGKIL